MAPKLKLVIVVAAILLVAIVVFLPWFVPHRGVRSLASCVTILKQIDGAKYTWALEHNKTTNDTPKNSDLFGPNAYIRGKERCPQGGIYTIGRVGERAQCSLPMHSIDFGWVVVWDETGAPVAGAHVSVLGVAAGGGQALSDSNGVARVTRFPGSVSEEWARRATGIAAVRTGFQNSTSAFPVRWPVTITMKRESR